MDENILKTPMFDHLPMPPAHQRHLLSALFVYVTSFKPWNGAHLLVIRKMCKLYFYYIHNKWKWINKLYWRLKAKWKASRWASLMHYMNVQMTSVSMVKQSARGKNSADSNVHQCWWYGKLNQLVIAMHLH